VNIDLNSSFLLASSDQEQVELDFSQHCFLEMQFLNTTHVEHISHAFVALDHQWRMVYVSHQASQLLQRTKEELIGNIFWEVFPEFANSFLYTYSHQAVYGGKPAHLEVKSLQYRKWFRLHILPSVDEDEIAVLLSDITAHKQAEEQLQFQANILRNVRDSVIVTDLQGRITYWNQGATSIFGYPAEEMMGQTVAPLYPELDQTQLAQDLQDIFAGKDYIGEWKGRRKDGTTVWVDIKTTLLLNPEGAVSGLIGVAKDITARKQAEEKLKESERRFRALIENSADGIALLDQQGIVRYLSPSVTRLLGYAPEELLGSLSFDLLHPDDLEPVLDFFSNIIETPGKKLGMLYRLRHKDGSWRWTEGNRINLLDDPAVGAVVVNFRDVTGRKQLEAELHAAKEQLEAILHNINDGIIVQDESGKIIYANQAAAQIADSPSVEAMVKTSVLTYLDQFEVSDEQGNLLSAEQLPGSRALQGEKIPQINLRLAKKDSQKVRWVRLASTIVAARDQLPALLINVVQDITQFKELEQRKDDFILHVSHELRTPLTALSGFLELLAEHNEQLDLPTRARFFHQALENCQELTRMVNSILDATHLADAMHPLQREELSLAQLLHEVLAQLESPMKQAHPLDVQVPEQLLVWADRQGLEQILRNLLSNAFKYTPPGTPITIRAAIREATRETTASPEVCICVQDAGAGIPPSEQPLLFQKFMRLQRDLSGAIRGTGLGLYICKQLVEGMGGHIWVESSGRPGEGSRFCFTLPLR
jgi:PAS domain S-box-containing protein